MRRSGGEGGKWKLEGPGLVRNGVAIGSGEVGELISVFENEILSKSIAVRSKKRSENASIVRYYFSDFILTKSTVSYTEETICLPARMHKNPHTAGGQPTVDSSITYIQTSLVEQHTAKIVLDAIHEMFCNGVCVCYGCVLDDDLWYVCGRGDDGSGYLAKSKSDPFYFFCLWSPDQNIQGCFTGLFFHV